MSNDKKLYLQLLNHNLEVCQEYVLGPSVYGEDNISMPDTRIPIMNFKLEDGRALYVSTSIKFLIISK